MQIISFLFFLNMIQLATSCTDPYTVWLVSKISIYILRRFGLKALRILGSTIQKLKQFLINVPNHSLYTVIVLAKAVKMAS